MENFHTFLDRYLSRWKAADLHFMENLIDDSFQGIEVRDGKITTHGKEASVTGWSHAFNYFKIKRWNGSYLQFLSCHSMKLKLWLLFGQQ